jgi:hypothetical protein
MLGDRGDNGERGSQILTSMISLKDAVCCLGRGCATRDRFGAASTPAPGASEWLLGNEWLLGEEWLLGYPKLVVELDILHVKDEAVDTPEPRDPEDVTVLVRALSQLLGENGASRAAALSWAHCRSEAMRIGL